jgi:(p)ppGpp synthase/HD superfamily hydrolase
MPPARCTQNVKVVCSEDGCETLTAMARTDFVERSPLTQRALEFVETHHADQTRELDGQAPLVTHPVEVACLLHEAGSPDEVVAAGVLHDVLEDTDVEAAELEERFGRDVAQLVMDVSDDPSIEDEVERKAALRQQVADAGEPATVVFAADKISKARELRARVSHRGRFEGSDRDKVEHYDESLEMLAREIPGHPFVDQLKTELEELHSLSGRGD